MKRFCIFAASKPKRLNEWAQEQGCWYDDRGQFGEFFDRGSENETYLSLDQKEIIKLNDFRYSDDNLTSFFERIKAHNKYFDACPYRMIGFAENQEGNEGHYFSSTRSYTNQAQEEWKHITVFRQGDVQRNNRNL